MTIWSTSSSTRQVLRIVTAQNELIDTSTQGLLEASVAMRSKISLTNEFKMAIALLEIPVSG